MAQAPAASWQAGIERVAYRFQIDGDWMLRLWQPPRYFPRRHRRVLGGIPRPPGARALLAEPDARW